MMWKKHSLLAIALCVALGVAGTASAQQLFSWEGSLQDWGPSGFGNGTEVVSVSSAASTDGTDSLQAQHDFGAFSWDASWVIDGNNPNYLNDPTVQALMSVGANPAGATLDFDVIWQESLLTAGSSFYNISFSLQSDAGFKQVDGLAEITTAQDTTIHVSLPLDGPTTGGDISGFDPNSGFYRMTIAVNSDAGFGAGVLIDNLEIVRIPEPASLSLLSGSLLAAYVLRRRG